MVFSSNIFLFIFLPLSLLIYYIIPRNFKNIFLLIDSLIFYAWGEPSFVFVIYGSILFNYLMGLLIGFSKNHWNQTINKLILAATIIGNLAILFYFKYFDFFISSFNRVFTTNLPFKNIVLPIGISFFTFQGLSYIMDLYYDKIQVQKNPLKVALNFSFFPHMIAGPIVRYADVIEQIDHRKHSIDKFAYGVRRFSIGLAKKIIIANTLGKIADEVFAVPYQHNTMSVAWIGVICYAMQIYFDFSGYSDMAIGLGKMFGFTFLENFNYPYISRNITDFWRRWHISLSSWFRDYVYIPLGGNRRGNQYVNLMIVFFLTGLWHGAAWNFIIWGIWYGAFLIIEKILLKKGILQRVPYILNWAISMLIVLVGWVLFRAPNIHYALGYLKIMFGLIKPENVCYSTAWYLNAKIITILIIAVIASIPWRQVFKKSIEKVKGSFIVTLGVNAWSVILLLISIMLCMTSTYNPFIYFRF